MKRILIIDDDSLVLKSCQRVLEETGYDITAVTSGAEAYPLLEQRGFDLVLVDMKMPGEDGVQVIEHIRSKGLDTPILGMSGYSTGETIKQSLEGGADDFISKPFRPDELVQAVQNIL